MVNREGITAAEIAVLRFIHGEDAVSNIWPIPQEKEDRTPHDAVLDQLCSRYNRNHDKRPVDCRKILNCPVGQKAKLPMIDDLTNISEYIIDNDLHYAGEEEKKAAKKVAAEKAEDKVKPTSKGPAKQK